MDFMGTNNISDHDTFRAIKTKDPNGAILETVLLQRTNNCAPHGEKASSLMLGSCQDMFLRVAVYAKRSRKDRDSIGLHTLMQS